MIILNRPSSPRHAHTALLLFVLSASRSMADPCAEPPLFAVDGAACAVDRQEKPCACSEVLTWDPVADADLY